MALAAVAVVDKHDIRTFPASLSTLTAAVALVDKHDIRTFPASLSTLTGDAAAAFFSRSLAACSSCSVTSTSKSFSHSSSRLSAHTCQQVTPAEQHNTCDSSARTYTTNQHSDSSARKYSMNQHNVPNTTKVATVTEKQAEKKPRTERKNLDRRERTETGEKNLTKAFTFH